MTHVAECVISQRGSTPHCLGHHDIKHNGIKHKYTQHKGLTCDNQLIRLSAITTLSKTMFCHYDECHYSRGHILFIVLQSVIILSVVMINVIMMCIIMIGVEVPCPRPSTIK